MTAAVGSNTAETPTLISLTVVLCRRCCRLFVAVVSIVMCQQFRSLALSLMEKKQPTKSRQKVDYSLIFKCQN